MNSKIPELIDELKAMITPETYREYEKELKNLNMAIDTEDFFKNHPVSIANGNQTKRSS